jgi:hypothetical protein
LKTPLIFDGRNLFELNEMEKEGFETSKLVVLDDIINYL